MPCRWRIPIGQFRAVVLCDPIFPLQEYEQDHLSRRESNNFVIWGSEPSIVMASTNHFPPNDFKQFEYLDSTRYRKSMGQREVKQDPANRLVTATAHEGNCALIQFSWARVGVRVLRLEMSTPLA